MLRTRSDTHGGLLSRISAVGSALAGEQWTHLLAGRDLVGLDVDLCSVRMIRLRHKSDQATVTGAAFSTIAPWGEDRDAQSVHTIQAIRECLGALGSPGSLTVCGVRGPEVVVRGFEFPTLPPNEIEGAVELEASQGSPFSTDDVTVDHQVVSHRDMKLQGFWVAATRSLIEGRRQLARQAGLQCVLMDVDGLALLNCLEYSPAGGSPEPDGPGRPLAGPTRPAVLHVGDAYSTIAIVDHAGRPFVRDVGSAGHPILRQIARDLKMSNEAALASLLEGAPADPGLLRRSLEKACEHLVDDIITTLRYYAAQNRFERISHLLVCGRFATAKGLIEVLAAKLPIPAVLWNPVEHLPCEGGAGCQAILQRMGPAMAIAAGLAMRRI